jgi:hypothetical protein
LDLIIGRVIAAGGGKEVLSIEVTVLLIEEGVVGEDRVARLVVLLIHAFSNQILLT